MYLIELQYIIVNSVSTIFDLPFNPIYKKYRHIKPMIFFLELLLLYMNILILAPC